MPQAREGAQTSLFAALDESLDGKTGLYLSDCAVLQPGDTNYNAVALDQGLAQRLWDASARAVKL